MCRWLRLLVLSALLIPLTGAGTLAQGNLRIGIDTPGEHDLESWGDTDTEQGLSLAIEMRMSRNVNSEIGVGVEFQLPRALEDTDAEFNFVPLYVFAKMYTGSRRSSTFLGLRFGHNLFMANDDYEQGNELGGGLCYALSLGVTLSGDSQIELMYAVNNGVIETPWAGDFDVEYSRVSVAVSIAF